MQVLDEEYANLRRNFLQLEFAVICIHYLNYFF